MSARGPDAGNAVAREVAASERTAPEYALLGLLARTETGEIHGYDLARVFSDGALGQIVRLESGMLYHYLKKLAKAGCITTRVERQSGRPDRQVHRITPEGNAALHAWIAAPVRSTREIRLEFLIKLYLARQIDPGQARRLVASQQRVMRSRVERLAKQLATSHPHTPDNAFGETVLRLRLSQTEAALAWLATLDEAHNASLG
jgi:DNA-binding PadR family transcriptional regulator